jgi:lysine 6-dehydrogenase
MAMQLAVLGCGMMGTAAVYDLTQNLSITKIIAADIDMEKAVELKRRFGGDRITPVAIDVNDIGDVREKLAGSKAILGAIHYKHNYDLSRMAIDIGAHFCDLGGNIWVVDKQMSLDEEAKRADVSIIPDCGLAPGMVAVVVAHGVQRFDSLKDIHIRVGGLPQNPKPPLDYALVFSIEGLINEYVEPARVIRNGELVEVPPLTEIEELSFPAPFEKLEAFITSGGTSTLVSTYLGKIENLDYKTIRYPGHCSKVKTLSDLGYFSSEQIDVCGQKLSPREFSGTVLTNALRDGDRDCVLVQVELIGKVGGRSRRLTYRLIDYFDNQTRLTAMMRTTAFPAAIVSQMQADGTITARGTVPQELAVPPEQFLEELAKRNIKYEEIWSDS